MPLEDSAQFRELLVRLLPGIVIQQVAKPSGQRLVYFCRFDPSVLGNDFGIDSEDFEKLHADTELKAAWGDVVVKVASGLGPEAISYLQREISVLNALNEECYPRLFFNNVYSSDPVTEEVFPERLFLTIEERIDGKPLSECAGNYNSEAAVVTLLVELIHALKHLWERRPSIVHRDVKPDNILIKSDGGVVVIDLGISREEGAAGVTHTAAMWGPCTPQYSSPEQARNDKKNITFKSDFFALGTLAYELIMGVNPFNSIDGLAVAEILGNVLQEDVTALHEVADVSERFSNLVEMMMDKQPYRRPRSPDALLQSLAALVGD